MFFRGAYIYIYIWKRRIKKEGTVHDLMHSPVAATGPFFSHKPRIVQAFPLVAVIVHVARPQVAHAGEGAPKRREQRT